MTPEADPPPIWINPGSLLNRKRLFTTQPWVDMEKVRRAINGLPSFEEELPSGWIWMKNGIECYVLGDGNHRTAYAILTGQSIPFLTVGEWNGQSKPYGFNKIYSQVKSLLHQ